MHEQPTVDEIKKHVRTYIMVFVALMALTVVTVAVSYLHLPVGWAIAVALFIATIKGSLVASYFMHLISERKVIYYTLLLTLIFFVVLMVLPTSGYHDRLM
ncbi:MAG TPA: cytochrome C oxidase subunit IV family protein [Bacteroidota bacterium]